MAVARRLGGAEGTRTPDPLHAMEVRYQLRHSPAVPSRAAPGNQGILANGRGRCEIAHAVDVQPTLALADGNQDGGPVTIVEHAERPPGAAPPPDEPADREPERG